MEVGINPLFDYLYDPQQAYPVCFCERCGGEIYIRGKHLCGRCEDRYGNKE